MQTVVTGIWHGLIVVSGADEQPPRVTDDPVMYNEFVIFIACLHQMDGETMIRLGTRSSLAETAEPVATIRLRTPKRTLVVAANVLSGE